MGRRQVNKISGAAPVILSCLALGVVTAAVSTGWERGSGDEGSAAHIFQLLIAAEVPFIGVFLASADWKRVGRVAAQLGVHVAALALALAPVAIFKL